jgi:hypothetical protein
MRVRTIHKTQETRKATLQKQKKQKFGWDKNNQKQQTEVSREQGTAEIKGTTKYGRKN